MSTSWFDKNTKINEMEITDEFDIVSVDEPSNAVAQRLQKLGLEGVVLVADESDKVIGYITNGEILWIVAEGYYPPEVRADQIMDTDFMEVVDSETLGEVLPMISERYPNAIVVIDYEGNCVGYFSKSDYKDALAGLGCYDKSHEPVTPEEWLTKGIAMSATGKSTEALECYENYIAVFPDRERAWFEMARKFEKEGRLRDAGICYDKYVAINPTDVNGWYNRGNVFAALRNYTQAVQSLSRALKIEPENVAILKNLGMILSDVGKFDAAIATFEKAEAICGETDDLWYKKGNVYDKSENEKKAIKCYDRVLRLNNDHEDAWFNKGAALHIWGKEKKAKKCFEEVLRINPNNESAREAIAICAENKRFGFF